MRRNLILTIVLLSVVLLSTHLWAKPEIEHYIVIPALNAAQAEYLDGTGAIWLRSMPDGALYNVTTSQLADLTRAEIGWEPWRDDQGRPITSVLVAEEIEDYRDDDGVGSDLRSLVLAYPTLCRLDSIGPSLQRRWLYILRISSEIGLGLDKPRVRYVGAMHGNEVVGIEACLALAHHLLEGYTTDTLCQNLVNECDISIMPLMNPDGRALAQRRNANNTDLNRNFPVPDGSIGEDGTYAIEPETDAVMNWSAALHFSLSLNFHTGALLANYPWDYTSSPFPEPELAYQIAWDYAHTHCTMSSTGSFPDGITRGYEWYPVYGCLQDWSYFVCGDLDETVEISLNFWPPEDSIPYFTACNLPPMMNHLSFARRGIRGLVTDSATGRPLTATITIDDVAQAFPTNPVLGDYHHPMLPGTYTLTAQAEGYANGVATGVIVGEGSATRVDFALVRAHGQVDGRVDLTDVLDDSGVQVTLTSDFDTFTQVTGSDGRFAFRDISSGVYRFYCFMVGYGDTTIAELTVPNGPLPESLLISLNPLLNVINFDFESDSFPGHSTGAHNDWAWGVCSSGPMTAHSGTHVWATNPAGNYSDSSQSRLIFNLDLRHLTHPIVSFWHWYRFQRVNSNGYQDGGNVKVATATDTTLLVNPRGYDAFISRYNWFVSWQSGYAGDSAGTTWRREYFDLTPWQGQRVSLFLDFGSSSLVNDAGWYVDDLALQAAANTDVTEAPRPVSATLRGYPSPFRDEVRLTGFPSGTTLEIRDLAGRLLRTLPPGWRRWDGLTAEGEATPSGIYEVRAMELPAMGVVRIVRIAP